MDRLLYTINEASKTMGVGRSAVYELGRRNEIKSVRIGRLIRIPAHALREYIGLPPEEPAQPAASQAPNQGRGTGATPVAWVEGEHLVVDVPKLRALLSPLAGPR